MSTACPSSIDVKILLNDTSNWVKQDLLRRNPNWCLERRGLMKGMILTQIIFSSTLDKIHGKEMGL